MVQSHMRRIGITAGRASALLSWGQSLDDNERHETSEDLAAEAIYVRCHLFTFRKLQLAPAIHDTDHQSIKGLTWTLIVRLSSP